MVRVCVCVCVGCVCEHYEDRACAVHTGGTAWTPPKLFRNSYRVGALGAP